MANEPITNGSYQQLLVDLGVGGPQVGEKSFNLADGFHVRDEAGTEEVYNYWDVIRRADETYWSPLKGDRKTLYDITDYQIQAKSTGEWMSIADWFAMDRV